MKRPVTAVSDNYVACPSEVRVYFPLMTAQRNEQIARFHHEISD